MAAERCTVRLPLPGHRLQPGVLVAASVPGRRVRVALPDDVGPGSTVVVPGEGAEPEITLVLSLLEQ